MKAHPVFDEKETAILFAIYEDANGTYTSYSLAWKLNPTVQVGTPPAGIAFAKTRDATEQLIARGLVSGERFKGADGVYFNKLKLTPKGERTAIQQRKTAEETTKARAEAAALADSLLPEIPKHTDKK
jgi:hypothetical protein